MKLIIPAKQLFGLPNRLFSSSCNGAISLVEKKPTLVIENTNCQRHIITTLLSTNSSSTGDLYKLFHQQGNRIEGMLIGKRKFGHLQCCTTILQSQTLITPMLIQQLKESTNCVAFDIHRWDNMKDTTTSKYIVRLDYSKKDKKQLLSKLNDMKGSVIEEQNEEIFAILETTDDKIQELQTKLQGVAFVVATASFRESLDTLKNILPIK